MAANFNSNSKRAHASGANSSSLAAFLEEEFDMREPAISFRNAALKLRWAGVLFDNLQHAVNGLIETGQSNPPVAEYDSQKGAILLKVGLPGMPGSVPCLFGDFCHNCRSVFDYAWMGLVRANGETEKVTMPIRSDRQGLIKTIGQAPISADAAAKAEVLLGDIIRSHQDFQAGGNRLLSELNELSNWQKHNLLITTVQVTTVDNVRITTTIGKLRIGKAVVQGNKVHTPVKMDGDLLDFQYDGKPSLDVFFEGPELAGSQAILPTAIKFQQLAFDGLKAFCDAFPSPDNPKAI